MLSSEGLNILECLTIVTRSVHNCRVFSYYGGVQKVTALLKGTILSIVVFYLSRSNFAHFHFFVSYHFHCCSLGCDVRGNTGMVSFVMNLFLTDVFSLVYSAAVVKLKTLTSLLAADEQLSNKAIDNMKMMQKILVHIVTIISNFMNLEPTATRLTQFVNTTGQTLSNEFLATVTPISAKSAVHDTNWQQKAIVAVMEAGGVNWLVGRIVFSMFVYI